MRRTVAPRTEAAQVRHVNRANPRNGILHLFRLHGLRELRVRVDLLRAECLQLRLQRPLRLLHSHRGSSSLGGLLAGGPFALKQRHMGTLELGILSTNPFHLELEFAFIVKRSLAERVQLTLKICDLASKVTEFLVFALLDFTSACLLRALRFHQCAEFVEFFLQSGFGSRGAIRVHPVSIHLRLLLFGQATEFDDIFL